MNKALRTLDYLNHILQAIERIQRYTAGMGEAAFLNNELVQDAVLRNIEIIGEASNKLQRDNPAFAARYSGVPWMVMYTMRNRISHGYDQVDLEVVWQTVQGDFPGLCVQITEVRAQVLAACVDGDR